MASNDDDNRPSGGCLWPIAILILVGAWYLIAQYSAGKIH